MSETSSIKRIFLIHHSHTDIGYTETQRRIQRWHVDFLKQAIEIAETQPKEEPAFKWVSESFWSVEKFWNTVSDEWRERLVKAVKDGAIGLSGNYLNFSELILPDLMKKLVGRAADFGRGIGVPVDSAMTADINGFGWGFAEALLENGVQNLFTCIHTHHAKVPMERHMPFWWEAPNGERLLVWHGEHYHIGNEFGFAPGAVSSYIIKDECDAETIYHDHFKVAETRVARYLKQLEGRAYSYSFLPLMISGLRTDNAPPSPEIPAMLRQWNERHGDQVRVEMVTLSEFFEIARQELGNIPVWRGDWPDWWTDGTASMPVASKIFRKAQQKWQTLESLGRNELVNSPIKTRDIEDQLALYAEHTFSHSYSVLEPWFDLVHITSDKKRAFAADAFQLAQDRLDECCEHHFGGGSLACRSTLKWKVINPEKVPFKGIIGLEVGAHEYYDRMLNKGAVVVRSEDGEKPVYQSRYVPRGVVWEVYLELEPLETVELELFATGDTKELTKLSSSASIFSTEFFDLRWSLEEGIQEINDRVRKTSILKSSRCHSPFSLVYDQTKLGDWEKKYTDRGPLGQNRRGVDGQEYTSRIKRLLECKNGDLYLMLLFELECKGLREAALEIRMHHTMPRIEALVRFNKKNIWDPENLFMALPFGKDLMDDLWIDKGIAMCRPRYDQIPGTLADYYAVQSGFSVRQPEYAVHVAMPDTPLLWLGSLGHHEEHTFRPEARYPDAAESYAWLMSNYWETNFAAGLGGFHEYSFVLETDEVRNSEAMQRELRQINQQPLVVRQKV